MPRRFPQHVSTAVLLVATVAACGPSMTPLPVPPIGANVYAGTSRNDLWAIAYDGKLAHWDGTAWTAAAGGNRPAPRGSPIELYATTAGASRYDEILLPPGRLLAVDAQGVLALDAQGLVAEDYGMPAELAGKSFSWKQVVTNGTAHFAAVKVNGNPATHHLFRWQGGTWTDLQAPLEIANFRVSSDGRVIARVAAGFANVWSHLLYTDGAWKEIPLGPDELPRFLGDEVMAVGGTVVSDTALRVGTERLVGDTWVRDEDAAGSIGAGEIFLEIVASPLRGLPAVRYTLRRISGSDRYIEYGFLTMNADRTFDDRVVVLESDNVCSTACLAEYEDRVTHWTPLGDGSSVYGISVKPGDDGGKPELYLVDSP